jgi:multidrug resistance efflux pump
MVREDVKKERAKLLKAEKDLRKAQHELRKAMIQVDMLNKLVEAGRIADR